MPRGKVSVNEFTTQAILRLNQFIVKIPSLTIIESISMVYSKKAKVYVHAYYRSVRGMKQRVRQHFRSYPNR